MPLAGARERDLIVRLGPVVLRRYDELTADWSAAWAELYGGAPPVNLPAITRTAIESGVDEAFAAQVEESGRLVAAGVRLDRVVSAVLLWEEAIQRRLARDAVEDVFSGAQAFNRLIHRLVVLVAEGYAGTIESGQDEVRRELESADRLRHELVSMVTHDLKTPLTIIQAAAAEMDGAGWIEEQQYRRFLQLIAKNAERLERLINSIVDVSRIESRALDLREIEVDLRALIHRVAEGMEPIASLRLDLPDDLPGARGDPDSVERILVNLVDNAVRFSPEGEKVLIEAAADGPEIEVRVADLGPGVPPARRKGLFSAFYQVDSSPSGNRKGSGLGLAIVRGLAEAMGGNAGYRDNQPQGSVFWFSLPVWRSEE